MNILKSKNVLIYILIVFIVILIAIGLFICFNTINKKDEISTEPISMNETFNNELDNETDISTLEEFPEYITNEITQNNENTTATNPKGSTTNNKKDNTPTYYIKVNYGAQVVNVYKKDSSGNYTVPVKAMVCSTGTATPTSGIYSIPARWEWLRLQGYVWGHYSTQIKGNILFHSVPYLEKGNPASLEYWEYDKLGTYASAGCVRLKVIDAKWIYDNCGKGTKVEFYSDSNPGPLGKPSSKKISSYSEELRNWDPTDPNPNNPWKNHKEQNKPNSNVTNTNTITNTIDKNNSTNTYTNTSTNNVNSNTTTNSVNANNTVTNTIKPENNTVNNTTKNNTVSTSKNILINKTSNTN